MAKVRKGNRVLTIAENAVDVYLKRGYDQVDEKGKVVKLATGGKKVSLVEFNKVKKENINLKDEIEELKKENATLKGQVTKLENDAKKDEEKKSKKK